MGLLHQLDEKKDAALFKEHISAQGKHTLREKPLAESGVNIYLLKCKQLLPHRSHANPALNPPPQLVWSINVVV